MKKILLYLLLFVHGLGFAQTSSPIKTNNIAVNTSSKYAALFRYKIKRANGDTLSQYAWVNTNSNGVIVDSRAKRLNGYFSSPSTALSNLPTTYSIASETGFGDVKYIAFMQFFPFADVAKTKAGYDEMVAAGANELVVIINWADIFQTYSAQVTNSSSSWTAADDLVTYAKNKGVKVSIRFNVDMDDSRLHPDAGNDFYLLDNSAKDEWGNPARIDAGSGHSSLTYTTGRNMMLDFLNKALTRYNSLLGSQFLWYSVSITGENEIGYNYKNRRYVSGNITEHYPAFYDYSATSITAFRSWLTSKYGNVAALNASWGVTYGTIGDAAAPTAGFSLGTLNDAEADQRINDIFKTNQGKDWWQYNYAQLRAFLVSCKSAGATYAPNAKFTLEWGSCSDLYALRRLSLYVSDYGNVSDQLKAQFGALTGYPDLGLSLDIVRSAYTKKLSTEINDNDMYQQYGATNVDEMKAKATAMAQVAIQNNAKEIVIIADKNNVPSFNGMKEVLATTKTYLNNYNSTTTTIATVNYNIGEWLENYSNIVNRWKNAGGSTTSRVNMVQSADINYSNTGSNPLSLSIYPIHQFNFKQTDLKSSQYNSSYDNSRVYVMFPTHSITYVSGAKATSNIVIKDASNVEWLRNTQTTGATNAEYSNNHPDRVYIPTIAEDSRFYLPIQSYTITITNTGSVNLTFWVQNPDPDANAINFKRKITPGETYTYTLSSTYMSSQPYWNRGIKINCNRDSETDTL